MRKNKYCNPSLKRNPNLMNLILFERNLMNLIKNLNFVHIKMFRRENISRIHVPNFDNEYFLFSLILCYLIFLVESTRFLIGEGRI